MSTRSRIIDRVVPSGVTEIEVEIPEFTAVIQTVLDRTMFEASSSDKEELCEVRILDAATGMSLGAAGWRGGESIDTDRPGNRYLWSFGRWPLPSDVAKVRFRLTAHEAFHCRADVDFFTVGEER